MKKALLGVLLSLVLAGCAGIHPAPPDEAAKLDCEPFPAAYQEMIRADMSRRLFDPMSAQYQFYEPAKAKYKGGCGWYMRVDVNAKNRFGGYVGAQIYQYIIHQGQLEEINIIQSGILNAIEN